MPIKNQRRATRRHCLTVCLFVAVLLWLLPAFLRIFNRPIFRVVRLFAFVGWDAWPSGSHISVYLLFNYLTYQSSLWLDQGSVLAVHFVVQATGVAQIVSRSIASPQWRRCGATIHTLASLCKNYTKLVDGVRKTKIALIFLTICYNKYSLNGELHILLCSKLGL